MKTQITKPVFELRITGKVTRPTIGLDDSRFVYRDKDHTDLAETWRKAREQFAGQERPVRKVA